MLCFLHIASILSVRILVKIFRIVSSSVIGLVLSMSLFQSELFGMGIMLALFHTVRVFRSCMIWLKSMVNASITILGLFFQHSYVSLEGPAALLLGLLLSVRVISSSEI